MTTTTRRRRISDLRRARAARGSKRLRLARPYQAMVKWYNPEKGFGFVELATGGDAFLHVSVVERSGNSTVPPGATLEVRAGPGQKGMQVTEILSVDARPRRSKSSPGVRDLSDHRTQRRINRPSRRSAR